MRVVKLIMSKFNVWAADHPPYVGNVMLENFKVTFLENVKHIPSYLVTRPRFSSIYLFISVNSSYVLRRVTGMLCTK